MCTATLKSGPVSFSEEVGGENDCNDEKDLELLQRLVCWQFVCNLENDQKLISQCSLSYECSIGRMILFLRL